MQITAAVKHFANKHYTLASFLSQKSTSISGDILLLGKQYSSPD